MYKTKLQEECQRNKWGLPEYSCIKDGEDHNSCFRASVSVNGLSFHSPAVSKSSKHALNEAAKVAFLHFTSDGFVAHARHITSFDGDFLWDWANYNGFGRFTMGMGNK